MCQKKIGKVQPRHVNFSIGKVQARHVRIFPLACLIEENPKKILNFYSQNIGFRQGNSDMCEKRIGQVQSRHVEFNIPKVHTRHVVSSICLLAQHFSYGFLERFH